MVWRHLPWRLEMQCCAATTTKINKSWLSFSVHTKNLTCVIQHQTNSSQFSLAFCRAQIQQCRPFREVLSFNRLYCVWKNHICVNIQTNTNISLCMQLQQSLLTKTQGSTLFPKPSPSRPHEQSQHTVQPLTAESRNEFLVEQRRAQRLPAHLEVGVGCSNTAVCSTRRMISVILPWVPSCPPCKNQITRIRTTQLFHSNVCTVIH